jgi:hypothetical protein
MPTCRDVLHGAFKAIKVLAPGDMPQVDQLRDGLLAIQDIIQELHEARGPLTDVDVSAATYIASENQRVRIQAGAATVVTLPNAIPMYDGFDPYDYGFNPAAQQWGAYAPQGSAGVADNIAWRQPRDGTRIEIVGTTAQLFFYRADVNQWLSANALRLDDEMPLNARYRGALIALVAERLVEELSLEEPSPGFLHRAGLARATLYIRSGTDRSPVRAEYF